MRVNNDLARQPFTANRQAQHLPPDSFTQVTKKHRSSQYNILTDCH